MIWLLRDFDLLAVVLRAAVLAFEALTVGGVAFLMIALRDAGSDPVRKCLRWIGWAALGLMASAAASAAITTLILMNASELRFTEVVGADFFVAAVGLCVASVLIWICSRSEGSWIRSLMMPLAASIIAASVSTSHAMSRMNHRGLLAVLTAGHHVGVALWVGAMPFLLVSLRRAPDAETGRLLALRYSWMAVAGVAVLIVAGAGLGWFYLGFGDGADAPPATAIYGTAYGVMLLAKIYLLLLMLTLGAGNFLIVRGQRPLLARVRRFSEAEIGLGFTAILAAASLTSQPPAVDLPLDRLTSHEIVERFHVVLPSLHTPALAALTPPSSIEAAVAGNEFRGVSVSDAEDRAWSEYNHHWAGLIVLAAGSCALLSRSRRARWARCWPLAFAGLAVFILMRADPENWPLGPRPFWASFSQPDVLQHRLYAALILAFAGFELLVQTGWWMGGSGAGGRVVRRFPLAFPVLCAAGAGLMLLHSHALGNIKEELLAEMSHTSVALLGATAGWARWLELRLPRECGAEGLSTYRRHLMGRQARVAGVVWPICLMLAGFVLLNYRES